MDLDECSVKTLEAKTQCRLCSVRAIEAVTRYQYRLPEPSNWPDHDDAVDELRFRVVDLAQGKGPRVIGSALGSAINDLIQQEPEIIANMLGSISIVSFSGQSSWRMPPRSYTFRHGTL